MTSQIARRLYRVQDWPGYFMNWRRETAKMAVPQGNRRGVGSEAYLNSTSQGPTPEDARKDGHIHGRSRRFMKYPGYG